MPEHAGRYVFYAALLAAVVTAVIALGRWNWGMTDGHGMLIGLAWAAAAVLIGIVVAVISQPRR